MKDTERRKGHNFSEEKKERSIERGKIKSTSIVHRELVVATASQQH
jgi:hypothetical protein